MEEEKDHYAYKKSPLFLKAKEISNLCERITLLCEDHEGDEGALLKEVSRNLVTDSYLICVKIAGAWNVDLYDLKMENAALIRKAGRDIHSSTNSLIAWGLQDEDYISVLRNSLEEFRILFAEWVKTFDPWDYVIDRWGLFNPPGVNYDDKDPDEDLPFELPDDF